MSINSLALSPYISDALIPLLLYHGDDHTLSTAPTTAIYDAAGFNTNDIMIRSNHTFQDIGNTAKIGGWASGNYHVMKYPFKDL